MVKVYNIFNDNDNKPKLNIQREIDINEKNISIEESVEVLNHFFNMNLLHIEHAYLIGFDNQMNMVGIFLVSVGTSNKCFFHRKNIATFLILSGAERFIMYHNHPNGILEVSENDLLAMYSVKTLAENLEIEFVESVIVTKNGWRCIERGQVYEYDEDDEV